MANLLINPLTQRRLDGFIARPSHAVALYGDEGSGLADLAYYIRKAFTKDRPDAEALVLIEPNDKGTITIDAVRELSHRLKLHNSSDGVAIVTVINHADAMPTEAQNALLKLLEEPPAGVLFVLLSYDASRLLPTISSRCVNIQALPVSLDDAQAHFRNSSEDFTRIYRLSGGQPGLLTELLSDSDHTLTKAIDDAKVLLAAKSFERLTRTESSYKKREDAVLITKAILRVCTGALQSGRATSRWLHNCRASRHALKLLEANVQTKLVMDQLFLQMR